MRLRHDPRSGETLTARVYADGGVKIRRSWPCDIGAIDQARRSRAMILSKAEAMALRDFLNQHAPKDSA